MLRDTYTPGAGERRDREPCTWVRPNGPDSVHASRPDRWKPAKCAHLPGTRRPNPAGVGRPAWACPETQNVQASRPFRARNASPVHPSAQPGRILYTPHVRIEGSSRSVYSRPPARARGAGAGGRTLDAPPASDDPPALVRRRKMYRPHAPFAPGTRALYTRPPNRAGFCTRLTSGSMEAREVSTVGRPPVPAARGRAGARWTLRRIQHRPAPAGPAPGRCWMPLPPRNLKTYCATRLRQLS
jgi:hypothetical protein